MSSEDKSENRNSWQYAKHKKLYSGLLDALKIEPMVAVGPAEGGLDYSVQNTD